MACDYGASILDDLAKDLLSKQRVKIPSWHEWMHSPEAAKAKWAMVGSNTIWVAGKNGGTKYIPESHWPYSETELARPYMQACLDSAGAKSLRWSKDELPLMGLRPPMFFDKPAQGDLAHVDIRAAFWQIFSRWAFDVNYKPGRYFSVGKVKFIEAEHIGNRHRELRLAVGGVIRARRFVAMRYGTMLHMPSRPGMLAPRLWGATAHTLSHITADAISSFDCRYWHTDGGVFPGDQADRFAAYLMNTWGLESHVHRSERAVLQKFGAYKVGDKVAGVLADRPVHANHIERVVPLDLPERRLLRKMAGS